MDIPIAVLVVSDSTGYVTVLTQALRQGGYEPQCLRVCTADAIASALSQSYDLIIIDTSSADLGVSTAMDIVRARNLKAPVILVSDEPGEERAADAFRAGAKYFLAKSDLRRLTTVASMELGETAMTREHRQFNAAFRAMSAVVENIVDAVLLISEQQIISFANPASQRMLGYAVDEMLGQHLDMLMPERLRQDQLTTIRKRRASGSLGPFELWGLSKSGQEIPLDVTCSQVTADRWQFLTIVARDITERKKTEDALRKSEEKFRAIADYTYDWENWVGPDGKLLWVNPAMERMTGYSPQEVMAMQDFPRPLILEEDWPRIQASFQEAVLGLPTTSPLEFRIRRKDGQTVWGSVVAQAIYDDQGQLIGHRSSIRDITDLKRAEEALRHSDLLMHLSVEAAHMGVWNYDVASDDIRTLQGSGPISGLPQGLYPAHIEAFWTTELVSIQPHCAMLTAPRGLGFSAFGSESNSWAALCTSTVRQAGEQGSRFACLSRQRTVARICAPRGTWLA